MSSLVYYLPSTEEDEVTFHSLHQPGSTWLLPLGPGLLTATSRDNLKEIQILIALGADSITQEINNNSSNNKNSLHFQLYSRYFTHIYSFNPPKNTEMEATIIPILRKDMEEHSNEPKFVQ